MGITSYDAFMDFESCDVCVGVCDIQGEAEAQGGVCWPPWERAQ